MMTNTQTSTVAANYWGYRELTAQELALVGGGDDGGDGGDCGAGGDCGDSGDSGGSCGPGGDCAPPGSDGSITVAENNASPPPPTISAEQAESLANSVISIPQGGFGANAITGLVGNINTGVVGPIGPATPPPADPNNPGGLASPGTGNPAGDPGPAFGGKVICTELCRNGVIPREMWVADIRYSQAHFSERTLRGYHVWGVPYVRLMRRHRIFARMVAAPTRWFAEDVAYRMGAHPGPNWKGWALRELGFRPFCALLGMFAQARDWRALWAEEGARLIR